MTEILNSIRKEAFQVSSNCRVARMLVGDEFDEHVSLCHVCHSPISISGLAVTELMTHCRRWKSTLGASCELYPSAPPAALIVLWGPTPRKDRQGHSERSSGEG
jgi:hypothetical protein